MRVAIFSDPQVVGVEAGFLVVEVAMVTQHHPDGGIDDLGGDAVAILVGHPRVGIPSAAMHLLEFAATDFEILGIAAGRGGKPDIHRTREILDDKHVAELVVADHARRGIFIFGIDPIDVGPGGLGDMRIGGDNRLLHDWFLDASKDAF